MRFYLACAASFAIMLVILRSCNGEEYMSVAQASSYHHGKGGEAKRKRLKSHHKYYDYAVHDSRHLRWSALSAAVPASHHRDTAETTTERNGDRFDTVSPELGRTPQQIIDDVFLNIGWKQWENSNR